MIHRIEETVQRGICIGCGTCGVATKGAIPIKLTPRGIYQADLTGVDEGNLRIGGSVCPFSDESPNEDELGAPSKSNQAQKNDKLGEVISTFAGRVTDQEYLMGSSSGGMTSWLVGRLIEDGHADAVIKVGVPSVNSDELVSYSVVSGVDSTTIRKSQYYATTMAEALSIIENDNRRFILVGVPCFIRSARALCKTRPEYSEKLAFFIGLVCGHFKTQAFAESLAWQIGINPKDLEAVDFRVKDPSLPANKYSFGAKARDEDSWKFKTVADLVGGNWGHNSFQPEACNFCDDVVGETADVSFGDAWLPKYSGDFQGTNVVISRNELIDKILHSGASNGDVFVESLSLDEVIRSQSGGFRHRREGLAVRLADDIAQGLSVPKKRVEPTLEVVTARRRSLIRHRRQMAEESQKLFAKAVEQNDLEIYLRGMRKLIRDYKNIEFSLQDLLVRKIKGALKLLLIKMKLRQY